MTSNTALGFFRTQGDERIEKQEDKEVHYCSISFSVFNYTYY